MKSKWVLVLFLSAISAREASAQKGYEFEVYEAKISPRGGGDLELHTNFVALDAPESDPAAAPLKRAFRSAFEMSTGITSWLEGSFYVVGYARSGRGLAYVGNRARINAILPQSAEWPLQLGLSQEVGYARKGFAEDRWAYEISPIVQFRAAGFAVVANPALERSLDGGAHRVEFEPRGKISHAVGDNASLSLEYYGGIGPVLKAEPAAEQHHQIFASVETDLGSRMEATLSIGRGFTRKSDHGVIATKIEYHWGN